MLSPCYGLQISVPLRNQHFWLKIWGSLLTAILIFFPTFLPSPKGPPLRKIIPFFSHSHKKQLVNVLVLSKLDYGSSLYLGLPKYSLNKLQLVSNFAARSIFGLGKFAHISTSLEALKWLPAKERIQLRTLCILHKIFWLRSPDYLCAHCPLYTPASRLRSANRNLFLSPRIRTNSKGGRKLCTYGTKFWNALPAKLQEICSHTRFKSVLKTYLLNWAFPD